jgi:lipid II:glycine glycyltransferase (peptidoglycan interpeptide bridge formation enzyme)
MLMNTYIREITETESEIHEEADSFLQSTMWGEFKSRFGWTKRAFLINWQNKAQKGYPLSVLSRRIFPGFSFAYVPWGPQLPADFSDESRAQVLAELAVKLKSFITHNTVFIRFDPPWYIEDSDTVSHNEAALLLSAGFRRAVAPVQPPDSVIINLSVPCEKILAAMKPKWRYNISLAGKRGVTVNSGGVQDTEKFYSLLKETAVRDGIAIHSIDYYKILFEICWRRSGNRCGPVLRLYTAIHEGDTIAAIMVLFYGKYATYLYGASSNNKRNLMAPYALQWRAMQDAKEAGCLYYDLFGIPPNDDPNHPMAGLYRFKTGFGGQIIHRLGSWDYPYKLTIYNFFEIAESLRKKLRDRRKIRN